MNIIYTGFFNRAESIVNLFIQWFRGLWCFRLFRSPIEITTLVLLVVFPAVGFSQSPAAEEWTEFLSWSDGRTLIPEDTNMGPLANMRYPDSAWVAALNVCSTVLDAVGRGEVASELFHPSVRTILTLEFTDALNGKGRDVSVRYGLPQRDGSRLSVPVRLSSTEAGRDGFDSGELDGDGDRVDGLNPGGVVNYGYIYLIYDTGWFIEQWAVDISSLPVSE